MRRIRDYALVIWAVATLAAGAGCIPNRLAVSPNGNTVYFSLNREGGMEAEESSNLYALDIASGRLRAVTDAPGVEMWCELSPDGKKLLHMGHEGKLALVDLESGKRSEIPDPQGRCLFPRFIASEPLRILAGAVGDPKGAVESPWAIYDVDKGWRSVPTHAGWQPIGAGAIFGNRFVAGVARESKQPEGVPEKEKTMDVVLYLGKLTMPGSPAPATRATSAAASRGIHIRELGQWQVRPQTRNWQAGKETTVLHVSSAFSPDGTRVVAAIGGFGAKGNQTKFYEFDVAGKRRAKLLFEAADAVCPQWTPDGRGVVYVRRTDNGGQDVLLWRAQAAKPTTLARVPALRQPLGGQTTWRWMKGGRLRIYALSEEGMRIVDVEPPRGKAEGKHLSRQQLRVQKHLADIEMWLPKAPQPPAERWKACDMRMQKAGLSLKQGAGSIKEQLEAAWGPAAKWQNVPAVPKAATRPATRGKGSRPASG